MAAGACEYARLAVTPETLRAGLRQVGLQPGDTVYVASSLAALGLMQDPIDETLAALQDVVGREGTLVMPTFHFGFCAGEVFDGRTTPSECGQLSEALRRLPAARRSSAPPYHSVAALGARAAEIAAIRSTTSFGRESVFQYLHDIGARHLLIGVGYDAGVAHYHWLEELHDVPYRYWKRMEGTVSTAAGAQTQSFFMFARRQDHPVRLDADPLGAAFEQAGFVQRTDVGLCTLRAFSIQDFARFHQPRFAADPLVMLMPECRPAFSPRVTPVTRIHHIGIVSRYADRLREVFAVLNAQLSHQGAVPGLGVQCSYFQGLDVKLELVEPVAEENCVRGHLARNPTSPLHHLAVEVTDLAAGQAYFEQHGYTPLDGRVHDGPEPGQQVLFLSPALTGGLLLELVSNTSGPVGDNA